MPTYEYECQSCKKHFEYFQSMSEAKKTTCEACGGALERLISPSGFILKGGGWYKDLYASKKPGGGGESSSKSTSGASSSGASSSGASGESKAESKSEPKSEPKPAKSDDKG